MDENGDKLKMFRIILEAEYLAKIVTERFGKKSKLTFREHAIVGRAKSLLHNIGNIPPGSPEPGD